MKTSIVKVPEVFDAETLSRLLREPALVLRHGGLVAFPTETVYGLGANALDGRAVRRIFEAKRRPADNPLIVHVGSAEEARPLVKEVSRRCGQLMERFWPGPLTLIFPASPLVPPEVTGGLSTVAIRSPDHPVALKLIELAGVPVAAPSANASGRPSPTTAEHVVADLDGRVEVVIDGGPAGFGVESTVLELSSFGKARILRPGAVSVEEIEEVLGEGSVAVPQDLADLPPRSPGMKYRHYSPKARLWLVDAQSGVIAQIALEALRRGLRPGILARSETCGDYGRAREAGAVVLEAGSPAAMEEVARRLFGLLREFDLEGVDLILSEVFPEQGLGLAVMNRLKKASGKELVSAKGWRLEDLAAAILDGGASS